MNKYVQKVTVDPEWVALIREAKVMGLTLEEIRIFLSKLKKNEQITY